MVVVSEREKERERTNLLYGRVKDHIRSLELQLALKEWGNILVLFVSVLHEVLERAVDAVEKSIHHNFIQVLDVVFPH